MFSHGVGGRIQTPDANIDETLQLAYKLQLGGAVAQLGARLDGIEEVVGSNPIGSTKIFNVYASFLTVGKTASLEVRSGYAAGILRLHRRYGG